MKPIYKKALLWLLLVLHISLIFSFSMQNATKSAGLSRSVTDKIKTTQEIEEELKTAENPDGSPVFRSENAIKIVAERNYITIEYILRKIAHITLFFILGSLINMLLISYGAGGLFGALISLVFAAAVGLFDETIQLFSVGRAGLISDVLIDLGGAAIASTFFFVGGKIYEKNKSRRFKMDS